MFTYFLLFLESLPLHLRFNCSTNNENFFVDYTIPWIAAVMIFTIFITTGEFSLISFIKDYSVDTATFDIFHLENVWFSTIYLTVR